MTPFYDRTQQPSSNIQYTTSTTTNVKPNHSSPSPASVGFLVPHMDYEITQPKNPKVSIVVTDCWGDIEGMPIDESVDTKAALYISMVQRRLKLEQIQEN